MLFPYFNNIFRGISFLVFILRPELSSYCMQQYASRACAFHLWNLGKYILSINWKEAGTRLVNISMKLNGLVSISIQQVTRVYERENYRGNKFQKNKKSEWISCPCPALRGFPSSRQFSCRCTMGTQLLGLRVQFAHFCLKIQIWVGHFTFLTYNKCKNTGDVKIAVAGWETALARITEHIESFLLVTEWVGLVTLQLLLFVSG